MADDVEEVRAHVQDGVTGFVMYAGDTGSAAERLAELHTDDDPCRRMGRAGIECVRPNRIRDEGAATYACCLASAAGA